MQNALEQARMQAGLTQEELAKEIGVTGRAYRNYEHGTRSPSIWKALDLQDALGVPVQQLFIKEDNQE